MKYLIIHSGNIDGMMAAAIATEFFTNVEEAEPEDIVNMITHSGDVIGVLNSDLFELMEDHKGKFECYLIIDKVSNEVLKIFSEYAKSVALIHTEVDRAPPKYADVKNWISNMRSKSLAVGTWKYFHVPVNHELADPEGVRKNLPDILRKMDTGEYSKWDLTLYENLVFCPRKGV